MAAFLTVPARMGALVSRQVVTVAGKEGEPPRGPAKSPGMPQSSR